MTMHEFDERLSAYLDGKLSATEKAQVEEDLLQNPELRQAYEDLEPAYQIARLRIRRGLIQRQLAELARTKQPSIARLDGQK